MFVDTRTGSLVLNVDDPFMIRDLIPQSKTILHPNYNVALKHTVDTTKLLRNLGIYAPYPGQEIYNWPGKHTPLQHQREMVDFYLENRRCFNLSEMGTMKTAATLWAADMLMKQGEIKKALILAPLSTLERVWQQEIFDVLMHRVCATVHGGREARAKALAVDADFYLMNHDGVVTTDMVKILRKRKDIGLIIVDEGSMFRNAQTDKYKALLALLRPDHRIWWLTGTPRPNWPTDAWAQARIINPAGVPQFFGTFQRMTMQKITQFKWAPRKGCEDVVFQALQPAIRFEKAKVLDLPPVVTINRQAKMSAEQKTTFDAMSAFMVAEARNTTITAVNAADKIGKLRQVLCGAIKKADSDEYITLPHGDRLRVLKEAIDSAAAKVIVVVPFKGIINTLEKELSKDYSIGVLNGDVSIGQRNRIITDFKTTADPHVLLCHPRVMAHGLNLTEADVLIFYAPIYSNDEFQQVVERFNRAGQKRKMTVVRIGAHHLEWQIYKMVDARRLSQQNVLDLYKSIAI